VGLNSWQQTVLSLFVEIGRIEPLIEKRLNTSRPAGLDENQFAILSHMVGVGAKGETRASLKWAMAGLDDLIDVEIDRAWDSGLIAFDTDRVCVTPLGQMTQESAVLSLSPEFEQLLQRNPDRGARRHTQYAARNPAHARQSA
jgi:ribose 1,5-bisphosphokinase PhnN